MTLENGFENLLNRDKIYDKVQQFIYLISLDPTFLIIVDFLIIFCFFTPDDTLHNFCLNSLTQQHSFE